MSHHYRALSTEDNGRALDILRYKGWSCIDDGRFHEGNARRKFGKAKRSWKTHRFTRYK